MVFEATHGLAFAFAVARGGCNAEKKCCRRSVPTMVAFQSRMAFQPQAQACYSGGRCWPPRSQSSGSGHSASANATKHSHTQCFCCDDPRKVVHSWVDLPDLVRHAHTHVCGKVGRTNNGRHQDA
eukprot:4489765-Amphidinium_carterae.2